MASQGRDRDVEGAIIILRRLLDASIVVALVATALVVAGFVVSSKGDSHAAQRVHSPATPRHAPDSGPTLADLASAPARTDRAPLSRWLSPADYGAIVSARIVVHQSLRDRDYREKSFGALLALKALMTIHPIAPGQCAWFVNRTYGELRDFMDAQPGENWAPMVTIVRHDPPVTVCRAPRPARSTIRLTN